MKYLKIPKAFLKTDIKITIFSNETELDGRPIKIIDNKPFKCNYQSANNQNLTVYERSLDIVSVIIIDGDILNGINNGTGGTVLFNDEKLEIYSISLIRNPDGTPNYTRILTK